MTRPLPDLDELERLAEQVVEAGLDNLSTGLYMAYWKAAKPQTILTLIAAARERDELRKVAQAGQAYKAALDAPYDENWGRNVDDRQTDMFAALAQHRDAALATPEEGNDETL